MSTSTTAGVAVAVGVLADFTAALSPQPATARHRGRSQTARIRVLRAGAAK
jgi:hypothetical protein